MEEHLILSKVFQCNIRKFPCSIPSALLGKDLHNLRDAYIVSPFFSYDMRALLFVSTKDCEVVCAWLYLQNEQIIGIDAKETASSDSCQLSIFEVCVNLDGSYQILAQDALLICDQSYIPRCITIRNELLRKFVHMIKQPSQGTKRKAETHHHHHKKSSKRKSHKHHISKSDSLLSNDLPEKNHNLSENKQDVIQTKMCPTRYPNANHFRIGKWKIVLNSYFPACELENIAESFPHATGWMFTKLLNRYYTFRLSTDSLLCFQPVNELLFACKVDPSHSNSQLDHIAGVNYKYTKFTKGDFVMSVITGSGRYLRFGYATVNSDLKIDFSKTVIGNFVWCNERYWKLIKLKDNKSLPSTVEDAVSLITVIEQNMDFNEVLENTTLNKTSGVDE